MNEKVPEPPEPWMGLGASGGDSGMKERIDRPELRAALCEKGALQELTAP